MTTLQAIVKELTGSLNSRQKDVLTKRFCLDQKTNEGLTLAELGDSYGITRERIRQIEVSALNEVRKKISSSPSAKAVLSATHKYIDNSAGVACEASLIPMLKNELGLTVNSSQLSFLLEAEGRLNQYPEDKDFNVFWYNDKNSLDNAIVTIKKSYKLFSEKRGDILREGKDSAERLSEGEIAQLALSKKFGSNTYGDYGLTEWPEISPKTIRDRAYLILKKVNKPSHFRDIAKQIEARQFDEKPVFASTVHNELIKDRRFVLVGRGVYGLSEQGFRPGTTREVIAEILKSKGPLPESSIIKLVSSERQFKESTILLNLQNRKFFKRLDNGNYHIKEA